jgi:snRNA-activating protein complex subunit 3
MVFYVGRVYHIMYTKIANDYNKPILDWLENSNDEVAGKCDAITSGVLKKRQKTC